MSAEPTGPITNASAEPEIGPRVGLLLAVAAGLGLAGALVASLFLWVQTQLEHLVWASLPQALGLTSIPWWYVMGAVLVGTAIVLVARRLPGGTGKSPITGFHFDTGPGTIASVLLASIGTLVFGLVLGPEAPLIACGTAIGGLLMRGREPRMVQLGMLLGGAAAIGAIFGNPLVTAFMLLEFSAMGALPAAALVPVLVALGAGYIVQIGLGPWSGLGTHSLSVTGLPAFPGMTAYDIVGALVIGVIASVVALVARVIAQRVDVQAHRRPTGILIAAAVITALLAIAVGAATGLSPEIVLFSGQTSLPTIIGLTSVTSLLAILVAKAIAYAVALGGGFRGGPIFPAVTLGVLVGVIASLLVPQLTIAGMVATGIAATTAAMTKLPFTGTLLAVLLISTAGAEITPLAIIGGVIGFIARTALDRREASTSAASAPAAA